MVGDEEEDKAKPAIDALASRVTKITDLSTRSVATSTSIATNPGNLDGLELDGIVMPTTPIPRKSPSLGADLPLKDAPLNKCLHDHAKLANLGWDCTAKTIDLPTLSENGEWIYC